MVVKAEMPIDVWSMVVKIETNAHRYIIYGGKKTKTKAHKWKCMVKISKAHIYPIYEGGFELSIDVWSMVVKTDQGS